MQTKNVHSYCFALAIVLAAAVPAVAQSQRLVGTVTDSVHRTPLRDASVVATPVNAALDSVFHTTHTDAKRRFTLDALRPGRYSISVEHAFTDSIGLDVPSRIVLISGNGTTETALALPSVATLRRTLCPAALADTTLGVLLGVVRNADGSAAAGGRVVLVWSDLSTDKATLTIAREERTASTTTDSLGVYRACGVPAAVTLLVQAQLGSRQSGVISEQIGEAGVLVRDFALGSEGDTTAGGGIAAGGTAQGSVGHGVLTGSVAGVRGENIVAARVNLVGTARSTSVDATGAFRFTGLPTGTQGFEVVALGYLPRRFRAEVTRDTRAGVVRLDKSVIVLDSVRVIARRRYDARAYPEFEERLRRRGFGRFVTEEAIAQRHPFVLSDMLRTIPGITMYVASDGTPILTSNRGTSTLLGALKPEDLPVAKRASGGDAGGSCFKVYVDGVFDRGADVNRLVPDAVHGVEIYHRPEAPTKYHSGICGVILIWSK
jgi:hypothetical protein